jgi:phenylpropionate dioxygenase-like ring-hydroxylating dioxygenase large terminal subunit
MGTLFRRYWIPALLSSEVPEKDGPPVRVRILCEDLIAFRDSDGKVGLMDAFCPHRRAPMFFGRNEECGLRCVYHGWKFDRNGVCTDMPSEPPDSLFKNKVTIQTYPTWEGGGIVWTYMGPAEHQPPVPDYELVRAPANERHASKTFEDCNWLQALEGGLDTAHFTILHNEKIGDRSFLKNYNLVAPKIEVEPNAYGYRYTGLRIVDEKQWVRAYQYIMPAQQQRAARVPQTLVDGGVPRVDGHFWIPIDDETTWVWNFFYSYTPGDTYDQAYIDRREASAGRGPEDLIPGTFKPTRNKENDYLIDRQRQKTQSFTGIKGINTQDFALQEGMGPIVDRSKEHLGTSDRPVIIMRQLLMEAIDAVLAGKSPRGCDPQTYRMVRPLDHFIDLERDWKVELSAELLAKY